MFCDLVKNFWTSALLQKAVSVTIESLETSAAETFI